LFCNKSPGQRQIESTRTELINTHRPDGLIITPCHLAVIDRERDLLVRRLAPA
jgi:hypothetical protein